MWMTKSNAINYSRLWILAQGGLCANMCGLRETLKIALLSLVQTAATEKYGSRSQVNSKTH